MRQNEFTQYALSEEIIKSLTLLKYTKPTEVQQAVLPELLSGLDVVVKSKTGSGKTAAFAIPLCERVTWDEYYPQALVLEPTRELAVQVKEEIFHIGRMKRLKVPVVFGGYPIEKEIITLKQKAHIVVGTPGRVHDHLRRGTLSLTQVRYLIIDEADLMLSMGFIDEMKAILDVLPKDRVTVLCSATLGEHLEKLISEYMKSPKRIILDEETETVAAIDECCYQVENEEKSELLMNLLYQENPDRAMIFCATREMVNALYHKLKRAGVRCGMIHGGMEQRERLQMVDEYREGTFRYLIASDVAARGIDFDNITHVINYDFPTGKETYVHRIGRTGRNGKSGVAISFYNESESRMVREVEAFTGKEIVRKETPKKEQLLDAKGIFEKRQKERIVKKARKGAAFQGSITKLTIGGGRKSKMRAIDVVGAISNIDGITSNDIGIIDVRDSITYVEIHNGKGQLVHDALQNKTVKGKIRKVRVTR